MPNLWERFTGGPRKPAQPEKVEAPKPPEPEPAPDPAEVARKAEIEKAYKQFWEIRAVALTNMERKAKEIGAVLPHLPPYDPSAPAPTTPPRYTALQMKAQDDMQKLLLDFEFSQKQYMYGVKDVSDFGYVDLTFDQASSESNSSLETMLKKDTARYDEVRQLDEAFRTGNIVSKEEYMRIADEHRLLQSRYNAISMTPFDIKAKYLLTRSKPKRK